MERKTFEERKNRSLLTWQTKLICGYIAAASPPVEGGENILLEQAEKITLDPKELKSISEEKSDDSSSERPVKYADANSLMMFARGISGGPA